MHILEAAEHFMLLCTPATNNWK